MSPRVTVVLCTFNRLAWLKQASRSVLDQVSADLELIVVDNGSTDGTAAYLASVVDPRVAIVSHSENVGMVHGQNSGIQHASGEWIALIDDDDIWAPDKLARQLGELAGTGRGWSTTGAVYVDPDLLILGGKPPPGEEKLMARLPVAYQLQGGTSSLMWKRGILESDLLRPEVPHLSDWELVLRLSRFGLPALPRSPLVAYRQHRSAMSQRTNEFLVDLETLGEIHPNVQPARSIPPLRAFLGSQLLRSGNRRAAGVEYLRSVGGGNWGAVSRLLAVPLPSRSRDWLRIRLLSDRAWLKEAEEWLTMFKLDFLALDSEA